MQRFLSATRPLDHVPKTILLLLALSLISQCLWHAVKARPEAMKAALGLPPQDKIVRLVSLDDKIPAAALIIIWLQAFDTQPGISLPLKELNYHYVIEWLNLVLRLDNHMQYPLLAAARFYTEVPDLERQRQMIRFIQEKFLQAPDQRWQAMAHAVYVAKHRMRDLQLARVCARMLRLHATADNVPHWARQMEFFVLEDMGELEAAKVLIRDLLASGELEDRQQRRFLTQRLEELEQRQSQKESD